MRDVRDCRLSTSHLGLADQGAVVSRQVLEAEGRALLSETYATFSEGFGNPDLVAARALREELAAGRRARARKSGR